MYIIEHIKTYPKDDHEIVHTSFFIGLSKIIPVLMFTSKMTEAAKYSTKKKALKAIKNFGLEDKRTRCVVLKINN